MENAYFNKDLHVRDYISILSRRKWMIVSFFAVTVSLITWMTFKQIPIYRASSTVIVEVASPDILAVKDVIKLGETNYYAYKAYIETQQEIIKSRRIAHQVIKNLGLKNKEEFIKAKDPVDTLLKKLKVELVKDTRILRINVEDENPKEASRITNEFARVYVNSNISLKIQASTDAEGWLKKEVEQQKAKVREAEIGLQDYKEKNDIVSVVNKENIINDTLTKLNANYLDAQKKRIQAEIAYKSLTDVKGELKLENLPNQLADNEIFTSLKKEYMSQQALLVEYEKVYKNKHPKMIKLLENISYIESRIKNEIGAIKTDVESEYEKAKEEEANLKNTLNDKKKESLELERRIIGYNALKRELETNERMLDIVLNRLKETSISNQMQTNNVRVQDLAEIPKKPIRPKKQLNIMFSIILGMVGGIGLALFREYMDITIKDSNDIETLIQLPVLGAVPKIRQDGKNIKNKIDVDRVVEKDSLCLASESYRSIRTNLLFSLNNTGSSAKSMVITSSVPREGKTISAINLAIMMSNSGERVLLVDADMRRPRVHTVFNMDNHRGFSNYLAGETDFDKIIRNSGIDNLSIITTGNISHKPAELISSKNTRLFLEKASASFSKIIFDAPPIALVTDAAVLAALTDGVVLIAEANRTTKGLLNNSKELLHKAGANIIGVVLNNISLTRNGYYYPQYYYGKYYKPLKTK
ncbi:MAG: polysaccharide biosynthesis tyrosine autokinase [Candidatus Omnitrophica bacterium]|nr:polysaccharide biosynthesis tyrosine autokinase [Candidatus Omnitrophota bacterium]